MNSDERPREDKEAAEGSLQPAGGIGRGRLPCLGDKGHAQRASMHLEEEVFQSRVSCRTVDRYCA